MFCFYFFVCVVCLFVVFFVGVLLLGCCFFKLPYILVYGQKSCLLTQIIKTIILSKKCILVQSCTSYCSYLTSVYTQT